VEDQAFPSKPRFYKAFTEMDIDGDGYISYKDFESHLTKNKINASKEEILALMHGWLDVDKKGYIDSKAF
jgi:Ca2+-binding EF-hand superfamily protein